MAGAGLPKTTSRDNAAATEACMAKKVPVCSLHPAGDVFVPTVRCLTVQKGYLQSGFKGQQRSLQSPLGFWLCANL